jgi:predicted nucleotidyltransferase
MEVEALLQEIVEKVKQAEGVRAVVLGGSRARGTSTASSDVDLGIYYHPDSPLNIN